MERIRNQLFNDRNNRIIEHPTVDLIPVVIRIRLKVCTVREQSTMNHITFGLRLPYYSLRAS